MQAVVTGASSGIGLEAAVELARQGMEVAIVTRDRAKGDKALAAVRARSEAGERVTSFTCDMGSLVQVRALAAELLSRCGRIHVLVNNAGTVSDKRRETVDGIEQTFAVNHLAPFLLTNLLLERLVDTAEKSGNAPGCVRIVNVSSIGHYKGTIDFDNLQFERGGYFIMTAYKRSKLANVLFTLELARRLAARPEADGITVNALHPGVVASDIWSHAQWFARPLLAIRKLWMITPAEGGARIVHLATSEAVAQETAGYYDKDVRLTPSALAQDELLAARLWDVSAKLAGFEAPPLSDQGA